MATKPAEKNDQWLTAEQLRRLTAADPDADPAPTSAPDPGPRRAGAWALLGAAVLAIVVIALLVL